MQKVKTGRVTATVNTESGSTQHSAKLRATATVSRKRKEVASAIKKKQGSYANTGNVCIFNSPNKCKVNVVIYTNPLAEKEAFTLKYPQRVNGI